MKFNPGTFRGDTYTKKVSFSKAVLWKNREISLSTRTTRMFEPYKIKTVVFEDDKKRERWTAAVDELRSVGTLKKEGQEEQWYFPISVFKVTKIEKNS